MQNAELFPRYRYVMGVLDVLCSTLTHMVCIAVAPMLEIIAADFWTADQIAANAAAIYAKAGYATTLHILAQGIFMLMGPILLGWLDHKKTQFMGVTTMVIGSVLTFFAPTFPMLLFARFLTGAGHGMSSACTHSIIAAWFPPREKSAMVTINSLGIVAIYTITYTCTVPLCNLFNGSWRMVLLAMGIVLAVLDLCWVIFARDNHALNAYIKSQNEAAGKKVNALTGLKEALARKDVLLLGVFLGFSTIANNGVTTYLPQFLSNVRGFEKEVAASIVGVASGISAVATRIGGVATTALGKRKPIIIPAYIISMTFLVITLLLNSALGISAMYVVYTIFSNFRNPASQAISTELKDVTPQLTSSAASISFGVGFLGTFFASPLLSFSTWAFGEKYQMFIYLPLMLIAFVAYLFMPETGAGRKAKKS